VSSPVVAAIDLGSTSVKTLVTGADGALAQITRVTRLGSGVDRTGRLDPAAIERTLAALTEFRLAADVHGAGAVRAVATSACRDAANRDEFFDAAEQILGVRPVLLSGEDEGRLAYRGALGSLGVLAPPVAVVDIGGGSTEIMVGDAELRAVRSIDLGAGRVTERELHHDPPRPEELTNAIGLVQDHVDDLLRELPELGEVTTVVGLGGTVKVAAAVELGLPEFDPRLVHGFHFRREAVEDVFRTLATESLADRVHNPGLPADRAEVIVGGCCVLVAVLRRLRVPELIVSACGVLDAVAQQLLEEKR